MMLKFEIQIRFDRPESHVYTSGEIISGCVKYRLKERLQIQSVHLDIVGRASLEFSSHNRTHYNWEILRTGRNPVFVFAGTTLAENVTECFLEPGEYSHQFEHQLAGELANSAELESGKIEYFVEFYIEKLGSDWHAFEKKNFHVKSFFDLGLHPEFHVPFNFNERVEFLQFLCCGPAVVEIAGHLNSRAFLPGEKILLSIRLKNKSISTTDTLYVILYEENVYQGRGLTLSKYFILDSKDLGPLAPWETAFKENLELSVPAILRPSIRPCKIISQRYQISFTMSKELVQRRRNEKWATIPVLLGEVQSANRNPVHLTYS